MIEIELKNIAKYYGANLVLKDISFTVTKGERVAIVGKNGCGKSTIFNIISREDIYDEGELLIRKYAKIGYLKQIHSYKSSSVNEVLNSAFKELNELETELRSIEILMSKEESYDQYLSKYSNLQEQYEVLGGYEKETKLSKICEGLNIDEDMLSKEFEFLSGGEQTRVMLGKILIENPDILLLDEPTNHLDMKSIEWLENYLKEYKGTVIIISHDRYFLDRVVTKVIEIENLISNHYIGNYSKYIQVKKENLELTLHKYNEQQKEIARMEESIKRLKVFSRNGQNEKFVKRAHSMEKRLEKIEKIDKPKTNEKSINLSIINESRSSKDLIILEGGCKNFGQKTILKDSYFSLMQGEKIALIGNNGCGKSTFIDIILGKQGLDKGNIKIAENKSLGYLPQNIQFENEAISILDWFRGEDLILDLKIRNYLAKFNFTSESVFKNIGSLSGGEKTRLVISKMLYYEVNLLILDEPTNHLDIASIEVLEKALLDFKGTLLFISHDRYFINKIANKVVELDNYKFNYYIGNYDYYKAKKEEIIKKYQSNDKNINNKYNSNNEKSSDLHMGKDTINNKQRTTKQYNNITKTKEIESNIEFLEREIEKIDTILSNLNDEFEEINRLYQIREDFNIKLDLLLESWIDS